MITRTDKEWEALKEKALIGVLTGLFSNSSYSESSPSTLVSVAISTAEELVSKLQDREQREVAKYRL